MPSIKSLLPEDINYLSTKGAFTLPPHHILEAFIRCYFHHVHPFSPILDANDFLLDYEKGRMSLLLLWSMFIAAASFIDESLLTEDFYPSRTALKRAMYQRAKALYDADYEKDKITLIQSVFLMGHWYTSTDDRAGPWHWTGIAIGLSHTVGLHQLSHGPRPLWRRLWWSLYCREVWLSLGLGRPMRIVLEDSDTSPPTTCYSDVLSPDVRQSGSSNQEPTLSAVNLKSAPLTTPVLEAILAKAEFSRLIPTYLNSTLRGIVLYRPHILDSPREVSAADQGLWRALACQKTRTAASHASAAVNSMMAENLIDLCHTIAVIALIPLMQIHLFESTSLTPMAREMGKHNLALCMLAMDELRKSYLSANAAYKLFKAAINKIDNTPLREDQRLSSPSTAEMRLSDGGVMNGSITGGWPDGYDLSTAGIIPHLWNPFPNMMLNDGARTDNDAWLDIQSMDRLWTFEELSGLDCSSSI
ncbi:hypothetical protein VE02_05486 [Pseudogymnoascus sp. 03VT05]|nr:hypothetical protein VE02_05486 [Pseudogymnoascus sp. 03VT05]